MVSGFLEEGALVGGALGFTSGCWSVQRVVDDPCDLFIDIWYPFAWLSAGSVAGGTTAHRPQSTDHAPLVHKLSTGYPQLCIDYPHVIQDLSTGYPQVSQDPSITWAIIIFPDNNQN